MRADDEYEGLDCEEILAVVCEDEDSAECKAAQDICKDKEDSEDNTVVKSGDLNVTVSDYSKDEVYAPADGVVVFNSLKFKTSETITVKSVTLEKAGLTSSSDVGTIWLEKNGKVVANEKELNSKGTVTLTIKGGLTVKSSDTLDLVVQLTGEAGSLVSFKITDVNSSAKNLSISQALTTTYHLTNYAVASADFKATVTPANTDYQVGSASEYIIGKFTVKSTENTKGEKKDISLLKVALNASGSFDIANLGAIKVYRDSKEVQSNVEIEKDVITLYFDGDVIEGGKSALYTIAAEVETLDRDGDTLQLYVDALSTDVTAQETQTKFRVSNTSSALTLAQFTFKGGKIKFAADDALPTTVSAGAGYDQVVLAKGTLTSVEDIELKGSTLYVVGLSGAANPIETLYLEVDGDQYEYKATATATGTTYYLKDAIEVDGKANVRLIADIEDDDNDALSGNYYITSEAGISGKAGYIYNQIFDTIKYVATKSTNAKGETVGKLNISVLKLQKGKFSLSSNGASAKTVTADKVASTGKGDLIYKGTLSTDETIALQDVILTPNINLTSGGTAANYKATFTVVIGDEEYDVNVTPSNATNALSVGSQWGDLVGGKAKTVEVYVSMYSPIPATAVTTGTINAKIKVNGLNANNNEVDTAERTSSTLTLSESASLVTNTTTNKNKILLEDGGALAQFSFEVKYGKLTLTELALVNGTPVSGDITATIKARNGSYTSDDFDLSGDNKFYLDEEAIDEELNAGIYDVYLSLANVDLANAASGYFAWAASGLNITTAELGTPVGVTSEAKALVVKAYPILSKTSSLLEVSATAVGSEGLTIASVSGNNLTGTITPLTLFTNETNTFSVSRNAADQDTKVTSVTYYYGNSANTITITSDYEVSGIKSLEWLK
ncbi:MAG: hypothetical protein LBO09_08445, partial [Candidatus Peribacteria bacterium]|jgi:hypothetical protein|nr:hypothetical protein [Candidatus Peribacteria bacterium]